MKFLLEWFQNMLPCNFHYCTIVRLLLRIILFILNKFELVLVIWMTLEPVIQSEVTQKEKKKMFYNNAHICNLEKWS